MADSEAERQELVKDSLPIDGKVTEVELREATISEREKDSAWAELKIAEYASIISQRQTWSKYLLFLVIFIIVADFIIVFLVGLNALSYESDFAIPAFIGSSILEIFGLSFIVVQYLFPSTKSDKMAEAGNEQETI